MSLEKLVAISGKGGVYKMVGNRSNGLVLEDLDSNKRFFASSRTHQFTPLESISIYTENEDDETVSLANVFISILELMETTPLVGHKSSGLDIRNYFRKILPNHDKDKVMISDIRKIIKWFNFLNGHNLISIEALKAVDEAVKEAAKKEEEAKEEKA